MACPAAGGVESLSVRAIVLLRDSSDSRFHLGGTHHREVRKCMSIQIATDDKEPLRQGPTVESWSRTFLFAPPDKKSYCKFSRATR